MCLSTRQSGSVGIMVGTITGSNGIPQHTITPGNGGVITVVVGTGCGRGGVADARKCMLSSHVGPCWWCCSQIETTTRPPARTVIAETNQGKFNTTITQYIHTVLVQVKKSFVYSVHV